MSDSFEFLDVCERMVLKIKSESSFSVSRLVASVDKLSVVEAYTLVLSRG